MGWVAEVTRSPGNRKRSSSLDEINTALLQHLALGVELKVVQRQVRKPPSMLVFVEGVLARTRQAWCPGGVKARGLDLARLESGTLIAAAQTRQSLSRQTRRAAGFRRRHIFAPAFALAPGATRAPS